MQEVDLRFAAAGIFLLLCAASDLRSKTLPVSLLLAVGVPAAGFDLFCLAGGKVSASELSLACMPGVFLLLVHLAAGKQVGAGDGLAMLVCGLLLGWENCLWLLTAALLLCGAAGAVLMLARKAEKSTKIPFLPFVLVSFLGVLCVQYAG